MDREQLKKIIMEETQKALRQEEKQSNSLAMGMTDNEIEAYERQQIAKYQKGLQTIFEIQKLAIGYSSTIKAIYAEDHPDLYKKWENLFNKTDNTAFKEIANDLQNNLNELLQSQQQRKLNRPAPKPKKKLNW